MKKHTQIAWAVANGGVLVIPTINTTRHAVVVEALRSRGVDPAVNGATLKTLRTGFPWLDVVKVTLAWEERGR